jgi:hypothetical protein
MGGEDGYYAALVHELLRATGHPKRLNRATTGDYSPRDSFAKRNTVVAAQQMLLTADGFPDEAVNWHATGHDLLLADLPAARLAAAWMLDALPMGRAGVGRWRMRCSARRDPPNFDKMSVTVNRV